MKPTSKKPLIVISACLLFLAGVAGAVMARRHAQEVKLPEVISKVKNLEVVRVSMRREGEPMATLAVEVRNKSDKPVIAFSVESGDENDASGIDINGDISDGQPTAVIEPHGTRTVDLPASDIHPGQPIRVSGAIYADGSEDGDPVTLRSMHEHQKRDKEKNRKGKAGSN